jgi:hypothetical protein
LNKFKTPNQKTQKKHMNKESILGVVRHLLTFSGGLLVTKGIGLDEQMMLEAVGSIITLIGIVWSVRQKAEKE